MLNMKLIGLRPSSAITVSPDTPMEECIERMRNRNIGSILVLGGKDGKRLEGILTERDVLKHFDALKKSKSGLQPVSQFMTRKVISLPVDRIQEAGSVMLANHIRHLVITLDEGRNPTLAGVVSMRDLFREFLAIIGPRIEALGQINKKILLVADGDNTRRIFRSVLSKFEDAQFNIIESFAPSLVDRISDAQALFLDLDGIQPKQWTEILKWVLARPKPPEPTVILFNPQAMNQKALHALAKLSESGRLQILEKPLAITDILTILRTMV